MLIFLGLKGKAYCMPRGVRKSPSEGYRGGSVLGNERGAGNHLE